MDVTEADRLAAEGRMRDMLHAAPGRFGLVTTIMARGSSFG